MRESVSRSCSVRHDRLFDYKLKGASEITDATPDRYRHGHDSQDDNDTPVQPQFTQWGRLRQNGGGVRFP